MATHGKRTQELTKPLQIRLDPDTHDRLDPIRRWRRKASVSEWLRGLISREMAAFEQSQTRAR